MRMIFAAAMFAAAAASPAFAQGTGTAPGAPAAAAAPAVAAVAYVSTCPRSALAPQPNIPNATTATNSQIAKANKDFTAWTTSYTAFVDCKDKELKAFEGEWNGELNKSPAGKMKSEYDAQDAVWEKAVADYKATTYPISVDTVTTAAGSCGAVPGADPAPIPTTPIATASKTDIKNAQKAFAKWGGPRQAWLKCQQVKVNEAIAPLNASLAPLRAKHDAIVADYEQVKVINVDVRTKWDAFGKAYKARLKAAAGN